MARAVVVNVRMPGDRDAFRVGAKTLMKQLDSAPEVLDGLIFAVTYPEGSDVVATYVCRDVPSMRRWLDDGLYVALSDLGLTWSESAACPVWDLYRS